MSNALFALQGFAELPQFEDGLGPLSKMPPANRGVSAELVPTNEPVPVLDAERVYNVPRGYPIVVGLGVSPYCLPETEEPVVVSLRAVISWGLGDSALYEAEIDWLNGTLVSISAERIAVRAHYRIDAPAWMDTSCIHVPKIQVSAGVGYGPATAPRRSQLTEFIAIEKLGETEKIAIPPFASSVTIHLAGDSITAKAKLVGASSALAVEVPIGQTFEFPPNGMRDLIVENVNANDSPLYAFAVFGLTL